MFEDEAVDAAYSQGEEQIKRLSELKEQAEAAAREAEKKVAELQGEVSELQMQKEQTTLLDATELEKIRMEAEAEANKKAEAALQKKLDKAKKEAEKAKKEAKEAQAAIEAHEEAQKEAEETALVLRERLKLVQEEADKKVRLAGNQEMAVFKVHFENVQMEFNEMMTCIDNLQEKEPEEAGKMRTAMKSLCQNIMQILEDKQ
ncbi:unknown [Firmicutes bacterium CAG:466]|nr:unknown [Firmicutes bacterium CAG:466]